MKDHRRLIGLTMLGLLVWPLTTQGLQPGELQRIGYDQHIGHMISRDLNFVESDGRKVALGQLENQKPTLLVLGYHHCPMLCTLINDGLIEALQELRFNVGRDFNIMNVSIDPHESPAVAAVKKKEYLRRYGRPEAGRGWHFLTGDSNAIAQLANEAGFRYQFDPVSNEYAHPSGFVVLTPGGKISRYFFGVNFDPKELRSAIIAASNGQSGSVIQSLVLLCSHFNPITGKYGAVVMGVLRALSVVTLLALGWWIFSMFRQEPKSISGSGVG